MLYSGSNILPRSVFWSADFDGRSDNTDVITLNEMHFRISHLFCATALLAASLATVDHLSQHSAKITLSLTDSWTNQERLQKLADEEGKEIDVVDYLFPETKILPQLRPDGTDFAIRFWFQNGADETAGIAFGVFGHNELVGENISASSLTRFDVFEVDLEFHNISLPWRAKTSPLEELREHFHSVHIFPTR